MNTTIFLRQHNKPHNKRSRQQGVGLTELMIAMTLALFLILGLGTMFYGLSLTNKNIQGVPATALVPGTAINTGLSGLQDSERMAMQFLGGAISASGYYPTSTGILFPFATAAAGFSPNQTISGTSGAVPGTDSVSIRFESDAVKGQGWQGCGGGPPVTATSTVYTDTFSIVNNMLQCTENGVVYPLVNGVSGMTLLYGEHTAPNDLDYLSASNVATWSTIKSVYVTLQFINPLAATPGQPPTVSLTQTFALMNGV